MRCDKTKEQLFEDFDNQMWYCYNTAWIAW
jgi:hypothetical protein